MLHEKGFSSQDCFMFDQIPRRGRTYDVLLFSNEEVYKPHRDFAKRLRNNMSASAEICFGKDVWKEVEKCTQLIPFPLWGAYKDVRLYLELEDMQTMKRFVIHAYHPQFFCRPGRGKLVKSSRDFLKTYGRNQDLALNMAAQFVGLQVNTKFFETDHQIGRYPRLTAQERRISTELDEEFRTQLRIACPEKYQVVESRMARLRQERSELQAHIDARYNEPLIAPAVELTHPTNQGISPEELVSCHLSILLGCKLH